MKIETIEILLVCVIIVVQAWIFVRTFIQIRLFRGIIPETSAIRIIKKQVPLPDLEHLQPREILANLHEYNSVTAKLSANHVPAGEFSDDDVSAILENEADENLIKTAEIHIMQSDETANPVLIKIVFSINNYLIRNRGAASDFNLVKDIVERNTNAVEEDINLSIAVPLYLGLMGTMMGIVIGLFNMPSLDLVSDSGQKDSFLNEGIGLLIGGVKIAMIASFSGLLLTILNSGWIFKGARSFTEARKNDFYTTIQTELLPVINQGLASTLESLQRNLFKFNHEFAGNLGSLSGIFESNSRAIKGQKELLDAIEKAKVAEIASYNVKVLKQMDNSVRQFEKFNEYLVNVNSFVENSREIVERTGEILGRTDKLEIVAANIDNKLHQSQQLLNFLSAHFQNLEEHKRYVTDAVADVGHSISDTFKELKEHIRASSQAVKDFTVDEVEALKKALAESKTNLSNLEHLSTINEDVSQFKKSSASQGERIKQELEGLNKFMSDSIVILEEIKINSKKKKGIVSSIKQFLRFKPT